MEYITQNSDFTFHDHHLLQNYLIFYGKQLCLNLAVRVEKTLKYLVLFLNRFIKKFRSF